MNKGKAKCDKLKEIRRAIAKANNIDYNPEECTFEGVCDGTCPRCDAELEELNKILAEKEARGEKVEMPSIDTPMEKTDEVYEQTDDSQVWDFDDKESYSWIKDPRPMKRTMGIPEYNEEEEKKYLENIRRMKRNKDLIERRNSKENVRLILWDEEEEEEPQRVLRGKVSPLDGNNYIDQIIERYKDRKGKKQEDSPTDQ